MEKIGVKVLRDNEQKVERDFVLKEGKIYMPKDKKLRDKIIQLHHNILVVRYQRR